MWQIILQCIHYYKYVIKVINRVSPIFLDGTFLKTYNALVSVLCMHSDEINSNLSGEMSDGPSLGQF